MNTANIWFHVLTVYVLGGMGFTASVPTWKLLRETKRDVGP
jgi:hypothetical protein